MTFWNDARWQTDVADAIEHALQAAHTRLMPRKVGNAAWTAEVMEAIGGLTAAHCPESICAYKGSPPTEFYTGGEWMFDLVWLAQQAPGPKEYARTVGLPLALECEWRGWRDVWDDFDKLLLVRAGLRVFIFTQDPAAPHDWADILFNRARAFSDADRSDAWLLCGWTKNGFECHRLIRAAP